MSGYAVLALADHALATSQANMGDWTFRLYGGEGVTEGQARLAAQNMRDSAVDAGEPMSQFVVLALEALPA